MQRAACRNWLREDFDLAPAGNHITLNLNEYLKRQECVLQSRGGQLQQQPSPGSSIGYCSYWRVDGALIEAQGCHPYGETSTLISVNNCMSVFVATPTQRPGDRTSVRPTDLAKRIQCESKISLHFRVRRLTNKS